VENRGVSAIDGSDRSRVDRRACTVRDPFPLNVALREPRVRRLRRRDFSAISGLPGRRDVDSAELSSVRRARSQNRSLEPRG